jgi:hypothetical protein
MMSNLGEGLHPLIWPFTLLGWVVVVLGALIGGIFTHLLPKPALGVSIGFSAAVMLLLGQGGSAAAGSAALGVGVGVVLLAFTALGFMLASKSDLAASMLATSLIGSLLLVCAWDVQAERGVVDDLGAILRYDWSAVGGCRGDTCHSAATVAVWVGLILLALLAQVS